MSYRQLSEQIASFLQPYTTPDWDEEKDADAITAAALMRVSQVVHGLEKESLMTAIHGPSITPMVDGSVGLFWGQGAFHLQVHILADGSISYYLRNGVIEGRIGANDPIDDLVFSIARPTMKVMGISLPSYCSSYTISQGSQDINNASLSSSSRLLSVAC